MYTSKVVNYVFTGIRVCSSILWKSTQDITDIFIVNSTSIKGSLNSLRIRNITTSISLYNFTNESHTTLTLILRYNVQILFFPTSYFFTFLPGILSSPFSIYPIPIYCSRPCARLFFTMKPSQIASAHSGILFFWNYTMTMSEYSVLLSSYRMIPVTSFILMCISCLTLLAYSCLAWCLS